ncbi:uncharacterized protein LOC132640735 isoform X1 [Lycium barbarum]|uniref:uncharacterized protein LOC132640735 isoform X1 n=1 Tax=Lycium barbarum TaxID=112863 RepID=UPI00293F0426|nr:uncharacterized protein LOC132640735 isoform X1 [Lycium barbarum]
MPLFSNASCSTEISSSSSVSAMTTTVTATSASSLSGKASASTSSSSSSQQQPIASATEFVTVPDSCPPEKDEVAAILARQREKFLSCQAARPAQGRGENERHAWVFGATGFESTSSNKPVGDAAHIPAATAEQKYGESKPCSVPSSQPAGEEEPYLPPVDLLDSTIDMWVRVVANKKTDQEVTEEGLSHFYDGINYFCLLSERLQVVTDKYNEAVKAYRKLEDSERERLEHELHGAANTITTLTDEKESLLQVQMILHQKIFELTKELKEAGPAAIQKYKASSLYRQELMEYAAPYMGKGVKLAVEKIKAKDPTFDLKTYGLEMYILPPEADYDEFSSNKEGDGGADQDQNEVKPSAAA